jgi:hypothetical protein
MNAGRNRNATTAALCIALALPVCAASAQDAQTQAIQAQEIQAPETPQVPVAEQMNQAVRIAVKALDRGYGQTCDLKAMPAARGGYYPCVDIGPYRFVSEYANAGFRIAGYLVAGGEPFRFLEATGATANLLIKGPWETDLLPRAVKYEDDISGASTERKRMMEPEAKRAEAERRLRDFMTKEKPDGANAEGATADTKGAPK